MKRTFYATKSIIWAHVKVINDNDNPDSPPKQFNLTNKPVLAYTVFLQYTQHFLSDGDVCCVETVSSFSTFFRNHDVSTVLTPGFAA